MTEEVEGGESQRKKWRDKDAKEELQEVEKNLGSELESERRGVKENETQEVN